MNGALSLVYPVLAQVLLAFVAYVRLGQMRHRAFKQGTVRVRDIVLSDEAWPAYARQASNNIRNQFESPVLFYVLCGVATFIGATHALMAALAWVYVVLRLVHFIIHTTTNRYAHRALTFALGMVVLFVMFLLIVLRLMSA